jgi:hypothetical protein
LELSLTTAVMTAPFRYLVFFLSVSGRYVEALSLLAKT